ncbi:MAG: enoyl-CoA hydratase-related protein [Acidimicrobiales bacterium]
MTDDLTIERRDATAIITLDRPDSLNSLSPAMIEGLPAAVAAAAADRSCRAIVITASGERAFCAGIDVKSVAARDAAGADGGLDPVVAAFENLDAGLGNIVRMIHRVPVPVIAAVNGHAVGAGLAIAAASDLRLASTAATFADGFVKRGISGCEMGLSYFLPKLIGPALAFDLMLSGRRMLADEALRAGLVSTVTEPGELLDRACELAEQLAENAPMALSTTKEVMWTNLHAPSLDAALALEARNQVLIRSTADAAEARQSFLEKRPPSFGVPTGQRPLT